MKNSHIVHGDKILPLVKNGQVVNGTKLYQYTKWEGQNCPFCQMIFKLWANAKVHIMIHTGEKPYHCQYCNYSAIQNVVVRNHMKTNHKQTKQI